MGYEDIKAKKTFYAGTWYDSNLEARCAEALDDLGVPHEYHRQCFRDRRFPYGQYTPDFHLPAQGVYVEVAGVFDGRHEGNVRTLCDILGSTPDAPRVTVVDGRGDMSGCWAADGGLGRKGAAWPLPGGGTTPNLFEAAEAARG